MIREYIRRVLLNEAGEKSERQETGLVNAINAIASPEKPVTLVTARATINDVVNAEKVGGLSKLGKEPYTDIALTLSDGTTLNVSAKGQAAPSLGGGGLTAMQYSHPETINQFLQKALQRLQDEGFSAGDSGAPDVYGEISDSVALSLLRGTEQMGGPIDYMYQGPMDVASEYCDTDGLCTLKLNGSFSKVEDYSKDHKLYLRARKRRIDQPFDPSGTDRSGLPSLFGKSPSKGDRHRRLVVTDKVPAGAITVKI
tara:strand:+ start:1417 stop:2181 length:765 start_codon:yes stop_codon:yes gene_type:complete